MTPRIIKSFIIAIVSLSLFAGIADRLAAGLIGGVSLTYLLSLSLTGLKHFFIWQPITYLFIYPTFQGIHAGYLINLAFSMFVLWRIGGVIVMSKGVKNFLYLFFGSGLFASIVAFTALFTSPVGHIYAGTTPALYAMLMALIILFPHMELMLFLTLPVKAKWFIITILASTLLIDLSNGLMINFFVNSSAILFGYLYGVMAWKTRSPFKSMWFIEDRLMNLFNSKSYKSRSSVEDYASSASRIYDFKTGQRVVDDNTFMDACLSKISSEGKSSLTLRERFRMWRISRKKAKGSQKHKDYEQFRG